MSAKGKGRYRGFGYFDSSSKGFTLLETILAVTLFSIVITSSYTIFRMGIQIWRRTQGAVEVERKAVLALEKMGRDIRNTVQVTMDSEQYGKTMPVFRGDRRGFILPAFVSVPHKEGEVMTRLGSIEYQWNASTRSLCRSVETVTHWYKREKAPCVTVAEEVDQFEVQYWLYQPLSKNYDWYDHWEFSDVLPQAIDVTMKLSTQLKQEKTVKKRTYHRSFLIPVSKIKEEDSEDLGHPL